MHSLCQFRKLYDVLILVFLSGFTGISLVSASEEPTIYRSHAIAMHGEPKYNKDFISVEYISNSAEKGGDIVRSSIGTYDTFN